MFRNKSHFFASIGSSLTLITTTIVLAVTSINGQCPELVSGLQGPLGIARSEKDNLFVSQSGTGNRDGSISIVDRHGNLRTLLDGLPSGLNDINEPSGPAGLFRSGRTLFVAIGTGDSVKAGPFLTSHVLNPNPSSQIFSSVLAIHFKDSFVENKTGGFTLSVDDENKLASGKPVKLSNGGRDRITIELVANFPDFFSEPLPNLPDIGRGSNPFDLVLVNDRNKHDGGGDRNHDNESDRDRCERDFLYVTDGGRNLAWQVDLKAGAFSILALFPLVPNPLFGLPLPGGQFIDAVPTGIAHSDNQLLVTLFTGVPFPPGASTVEKVDPLTGNHSPFISGLKTAIDVLPIRKEGDIDYLVLQHASAGPFFGSPGLVLRFDTPSGPANVVANCLTRPTSMAFVERRDTLYVTELGGRIVAIPLVP